MSLDLADWWNRNNHKKDTSSRGVTTFFAESVPGKDDLYIDGCPRGLGMPHVKAVLGNSLGLATTIINPLRAKFFRGNINLYSHFMSLLHIDMTNVPKILPQVRPGPT